MVYVDDLDRLALCVSMHTHERDEHVDNVHTNIHKQSHGIAHV